MRYNIYQQSQGLLTFLFNIGILQYRPLKYGLANDYCLFSTKIHWKENLTLLHYMN